MPRDINKVILEGNLGADPVVRITPDGKSKVVSVPLYTSYGKKVGNEHEIRSERHNLVFFGAAAEAASQYRKGMRLHIDEARNHTRRYEDPETKLFKYITEVVVNKAMIVMRAPQSGTPATANG